MQVNKVLERPVRDIMQSDVVTLDPSDTMADAASVFMKAHISGAPVVDGDRACVGVLSITDIVSAVDESSDITARLADEFFGQANLILPSAVYTERLANIRDRLEPQSDQPVSNFMMPQVVSVKENDSLNVAIRCLVDGRIHRVIVVDDHGHLRGIVSTMDVLNAILGDAD